MIGGIRGLPPSGAVKKDLSQSDEKRGLSASGEKKMMSGKKSYSFHYDSSKDETFQKSPHFLRTLSMPRTDGGFEESLTAFQESLGLKKEQKPERKKTKLDLIIEKETENLRELYKEETKNRAQEVENILKEHWEGKLEDLHREYKQKINELEKAIEEAHIAHNTETTKRGHQNNLRTIREELEEKYYKQYLQRVDEIKRNFERIDEENKADIIENIIKELEPIYGEDLAAKIIKLEKDLNQEIEKKKMESTIRSGDLKHTLESSLGKYNLPFGSNGENKGVDEAHAIKVYYEGVISTLRDKYEKEEKDLWKELAIAEERAREARGKNIEERMGKEFKRREKLLDVEWRQRMEKYNTSLKKKYESQLKSQIDDEKKSLMEEKNEIGRLKSQTSLKVSKSTKITQELEQKLSRQEEIYMKEINELEGLLNNLKEQYPNKWRPQPKFEPSGRSNIPVNDKNKLSGFNHTFNDVQDKENKNQHLSSQHDKVYQKIKRHYRPNDENQRRKSLNERRASNSFVEEKALKERQQNENSQLFTQEPKGPYMQSLQNKLKKFEGILRRSGNDEIMKTIMDVMKPPELPSMKGKENRILSEVSKEINESSKDRYQTKLKERVSTKGNETDKSEYILKSDSSVAYNQLKEEILKKYQPKETEENEQSMHASDLKENKRDLVPTKDITCEKISRKGNQVRFQNGIKGSIEKRDKSREKSREKFRKEETKQQNQDYQRETDDNDDGNILRDYIDQERESMRRSTSRNQRSSYGSRMKKEYLEMDSRYDDQEISRPSVGKADERYQEFVNKYLGKGQSEREIAAERIKQSSKQVGLRTKYQEIFEIKESDTAQVELTYFLGTEDVIDKKSEEV